MKSKSPDPSSIRSVHSRSDRPTFADYSAAFRQLKVRFTLNEITGRIEVNGQVLTDTLQSIIQNRMDECGLRNLKGVENAIRESAASNPTNPIKHYLESTQWDGAPHIGPLASFFHEVSTVPIFPVVLRKWLIGAVARIYSDTEHYMLVLCGAQGTGKSFFARWLCFSSEFFVESSIRPDSKDDQIRLTNCWIQEVGELGSTTRRADVDALKFFLTMRRVNVRLPYGHFSEDRRAITSFIGSVNNDDRGFLTDTTGNRRFVIVDLGDAPDSIDWGGYSSSVSKDQVWAEAFAAWKSGESYVLTPEEFKIASAINQRYEIQNPLEDIILKYFEKVPYVFRGSRRRPSVGMGSVEIAQIIRNHGFGEKSLRAICIELSPVMKKLGFERYQDKDTDIRGYAGIQPKKNTSARVTVIIPKDTSKT